jgi:hypothetical protein
MKTLKFTKFVFIFFVLAFAFVSCDMNEGPVGTFEDLAGKIPNLTPIQGAENTTLKVTRTNTESYFKATVSNISGESAIKDGEYFAWCAHWSNPINIEGAAYDGVSLYSTLSDKNFNRLNYLLNQRRSYYENIPGATYKEIQAAVWKLIEYKDYDVETNTALQGLNKEVVYKILADVNQNGSNFKPGIGQVSAVFADMSIHLTSNNTTQTVILEGETAWAYGGETSTFSDLNLSAKWGWVIHFNADEEQDPPLVPFEFWAGAGLNDFSKGVHIGNGTISKVDDNLRIVLNLFPGYSIGNIHIFAHDVPPTTDAPGQFPFNENFGMPQSSYERTIPYAGTFPGGYLSGHSYNWNSASIIYVAIHSGEIYKEAD